MPYAVFSDLWYRRICGSKIAYRYRKLFTLAVLFHLRGGFIMHDIQDLRLDAVLKKCRYEIAWFLFHYRIIG